MSYLYKRAPLAPLSATNEPPYLLFLSVQWGFHGTLPAREPLWLCRILRASESPCLHSVLLASNTLSPWYIPSKLIYTWHQNMKRDNHVDILSNIASHCTRAPKKHGHVYRVGHRHDTLTRQFLKNAGHDMAGTQLIHIYLYIFIFPIYLYYNQG